MYSLVLFLLFIILPFCGLYLILKSVIGTKTKNWLSIQADKIKWYKLFIYLSLTTLFLFAVAVGLWIKFVTDKSINLDNSGMGLVIFIPPIIMTLILLFASIFTWYLHFKKDIKTNNIIFAIMGLLVLPVSLLAICSIVWTILIIT